MDSALIQALDKQANHELTASMAYMAMANWCKAEDYSGFAEFFTRQAEEEREHADKIHSHLLDRGILPQIGLLPAPKGCYESLQEIASTALALEVENSKGIQAAYEHALAAKDYPSQVMLQWFILEQVEEEAWANSMVTHTSRLTCPGAYIYLDRHLTKILESDD